MWKKLDKELYVLSYLYYSHTGIWALDIHVSYIVAEENGIPGENHRPVTSHWQTLSHNVVSSTPRH
jgi:hypothetical protein